MSEPTPPRPTIDEAVASSLEAAVPPRLARRLVEQPDLALAWAWAVDEAGARVTTDGGEVVRLPSASVTAPEQVTCTCLLTPRCLHVLAVVRALARIGAASPGRGADQAQTPQVGTAPGAAADTRGPSAGPALDGPPAPQVGTAPDATALAGEPSAGPALDGPRAPHDPPTGAPGLAAAPLTPPQRAVAAALRVVVGRLLDAGLDAAFALVQADLRRAEHDARAVGLHRAARAAAEVLAQTQAWLAVRRVGHPTALVAALLELAQVAHALGAAVVDAATLGEARRARAPVSHLALVGLCAEPVGPIAGSAGVVTYFAAPGGRVVSLLDVRPGTADRIDAAYRAAVPLGDLTLSPRELARSALALENASLSADGRLGLGRGVRGARTGPASASAPVVDALFATPFSAQLERAIDAQRLPAGDRAGRDLVFCAATVVGPSADGCVLAVRDHGVWLARPPWSGTPPRFAENLRRLSEAPELRGRFVARPSTHLPGRLQLLAVELLPDQGCALPEALRDRVQLGLDDLRPGQLPTPRPASVVALPSAVPRPVDALGRHVEALALGGRAALTAPARQALAEDARALRAHLAPTCAEALEALVGADARTLSDRWLAAATAHAVVRAELCKAAGRADA